MGVLRAAATHQPRERKENLRVKIGSAAEIGAKRRRIVDSFAVPCMCQNGTEGVRAPMTKSAKSERARPPDKDRREIAKRIFDALCSKYPEKYIALVQPRDVIPVVPTET